MTHDLTVGQVWAYHSRGADQGSTLTIAKLEDVPNVGRVVHIGISGVHLKNPRNPTGYSDSIPHMPFTPAAIEQSITDLVGRAGMPDGFDRGYQEWQKAHGGVFSISVAEAVEFVETSMHK